MTPPRVFAPAIASGLLLWAAFYPLNLGFVAFVALVPVLSLVRADVPARRRYAAAYLGGLTFFVLALNWIRVAHPAMWAAYLGLAVVCAGYWPLAVLLLRQLDKLGRPPLALTLPVVWVALEYVRAHFPTGFAFLSHVGLYQLAGFGWYFLGHALHDYPWLIQTADLGGAYLVSAFVAVVNGAVYEWAARTPAGRRLLLWPPDRTPGFYREMWTAAAAALWLVGFVMYGTTKLVHPEFPRGPRVSAIQEDIPQDVKMGDPRALFAKHDDLTRTAMLKADLVVWPETCYPFGLDLIAPGTDPATVPAEAKEYVRKSRENLMRASEPWKTPTLIGLSVDEWAGPAMRKYNSALLVLPTDGPTDRYDKIHLVPFGEYVPFRETFPFLRRFTPYGDKDYSCTPGESLTRFPLNVGGTVYTFGVLICYEDSEPYLARQYVRPTGAAEPVDFLVNISNDGWFKGTEEHEQHLAICKFRAVEARRPVVRAVNMGVSAVIDSEGKVQAVPGDSVAGSVRVRGTVTDHIRLDRRQSLYAVYGDWLPAACWVLLVGGLVLARRRAGSVSDRR